MSDARMTARSVVFMSEFRRALSAGGWDHPFPAVWVLPTKIAVLHSKQDSSDGVNCLSAESEDLLRSLMTRAAKGESQPRPSAADISGG